MNYSSFKKYQATLSDTTIRLDELNPYKLRASIPKKYLDQSYQSSIPFAAYWKISTGVRVLLAEILENFYQKGYEAWFPEDVYPEYFRLIREFSKATTYQSVQTPLFKLPEPAIKGHQLLLTTNPLIPEGRYLSDKQLESIDYWLCNDENRWVIFDTVYDYKFQAMNYNFIANNVIYVGSYSKTHLTPGSYGWAISKEKKTGFEKNSQGGITIGFSQYLQNQYTTAWENLYDRHSTIPISPPPDVGYLSIIEKEYTSLLYNHNIAAIPGSVFGIKNSNISVLSCLTEVKNELLK